MSELGDKERRFVEDQRRVRQGKMEMVVGFSPERLIPSDELADPYQEICELQADLEHKKTLLAEAAEVLREFPIYHRVWREGDGEYDTTVWWQTRAKPLLDKLGERE